MTPWPAGRPAPSARPRQPLSASLAEILACEPPPGGLTLNALFAWTEGRGVFLFIVLLGLPFLVPVSLPGMSAPLGGVILVLALRLALGRAPRLPRLIGERPLPAKFKRVLEASVRVLQFMERWLVRPRRSVWMSWPLTRLANGLCLAAMAFYLALPIPLPFTNTLPGYAIVLLSLSMMEEDGLLVWLAYAVTAASVAYLIAIADAAWVIGVRHWSQVVAWFQSLL